MLTEEGVVITEIALEGEKNRYYRNRTATTSTSNHSCFTQIMLNQETRNEV